ncbi:MAG: hypothetical protein MMC33_008005 [Icmadophila ericetorum]|nr:hypothetical protein [Icmadophila ericetorum]
MAFFETNWSVLFLRLSAFFIALCLSFLFTSALYNIYFHPLSKFPGPRLAAATRIPYLLALLQGRPSQWTKDLHDYYDSEVVRISPEELSFIDQSAWNDILVRRHGQPSFLKDLGVYRNDVNSLLTANDTDHSRQRRILAHAFSDKALRMQEHLIMSYVDTLIKELNTSIDSPTRGKVDLVAWFRWLTFDIVSDLSFGEHLNSLRSTRYHYWVSLISGSPKIFVYTSAIRRIPVLSKLLPYIITKKMKQGRKYHTDMISRKIEQRMNSNTQQPDFLSYTMKYNDEKGMTMAEIKENAALFIGAGSESTSTVLAGAAYYLLENSAVHEKLVNEIRQFFKTDEEITQQSVLLLPYLSAVLTETKRIYPPSQAGHPRRVPVGGANVSGRWIPGGVNIFPTFYQLGYMTDSGQTGVTINQWACNRSARNFREPDKFIPERWLDDPRFSSDQKGAYQPYSVGSGNCIGKNLALAEMRLTLAKFIWHFDLHRVDETNRTWSDQKVFLRPQKTPLIVQLTKRVHETEKAT